jgi:hypothetical protein
MALSYKQLQIALYYNSRAYEKKYALLNILTHKEYDRLFGYDTS